VQRSKSSFDRVNAGRPASSAELLREVGIGRTAFVEKAAALNGTPIHPIRLVHELQTLLSDDMTLCLDMRRRHPGEARAIAEAHRGEEDFRSSFSPIQEVGCTACFRVSDTRCGTCVIFPAFLQSRCAPS
jgi:hypothetical protein